MTAFVVAPSAVAARMMEQLLKRAGFTEVRSFCDGARAREALRDSANPSPDLLVTEWDLSADISGLDLVREVRNANPSATTLLVSTRNTRNDVREALASGIDVYLLKPFDPDLFIERAAALSSRGGDQEMPSAA